MQIEDVLGKIQSTISDIAWTQEKLVFTDAKDHTLSFFDATKVNKSLGGTQGMQDGFSAYFNLPSVLTSSKENVCDVNNQAIRIVSSLKSFEKLGKKIGTFIELFDLDGEKMRKVK